MASRVVMPKLTDTMEEGVVLKWKRHEGDRVEAGDVLAEIETDKAVMDLEAFASGTVRRLLAQEGDTVKAGALIAVVAEPDEDIAEALADAVAPAASAQAAPATTAGPASRPAGSPTGSDALKASPRARKLATEQGIDLASLVGTGPEGRIVEEDIRAAMAGRPEVSPTPGLGTDRPLSQMRKAIARAMTQSKAPVPHFYLTTEIAMEEAEQIRAKLKEGRRDHPHVPSMTDLLVKAAALALARHPEINVSYGDTAIRRHPTIDIGIAVGLDDGLLSPVLRNCGAKTLEEITIEVRTLLERARSRKLQPQEYTGATFSISNLGMFDVDNFIAILMPPEAAALAVGAIRDVPIVEGTQVKAGRRMKVTLSCDHRVLDGMQGAKFLREFKRVLEHPSELTQPKETR